MQLAGNNIIQVLDIASGDVWRGPIESLFEKFSSYIKYEEDHQEFIPKDMRITDWTGWSHIESIKRFTANDIKWMKVSLQGHTVICTSDSTVLEWQADVSKRSFQGRPVWNYQCVTLQDIKPKSVGRILNLNADPTSTFFDNYIVEPIDYDRKVYYEIYTHSRFYNVNRILDASVGQNHLGWK